MAGEIPREGRLYGFGGNQTYSLDPDGGEPGGSSLLETDTEAVHSPAWIGSWVDGGDALGHVSELPRVEDGEEGPSESVSLMQRVQEAAGFPLEPDSSNSDGEAGPAFDLAPDESTPPIGDLFYEWDASGDPEASPSNSN